jgi:predicted alpha-1,2-mannosidase
MGNFPLFPMPPCKDNIPDGCAPFNKRQRALHWKDNSVMASPGYFSIELTNDIRTEMTTSTHAALYRFTYPNLTASADATSRQMFVLSDLTDLYDSKAFGYVEVDHKTGRIRGNGNYMSGFGNSGRYTSYFCADFSGAPLISAGLWTGDVTQPNEHNMSATSTDSGAYVQFYRPDGVDQLYARVGQSLISLDRACENAELEIPSFEGAFERLQNEQKDVWRTKLDPIKVNPGGASQDLQSAFWSGVYRNFISPQNYTNENPRWESPEPFWDSYYCIWDEARAQFPLLTIIDPNPLEEMIRALINIYEHEGYLPDCHMQLDKGIVQGGSNADMVIADWAVKMGLTPNIDWDKAYAGLVKDAEVEPSLWLVEGRGHLDAYKQYGYIPNDIPTQGRGLGGAQISRTVEYAYDDYCIASVAHMMNKTDDYNKYIGRSENWKNMLRLDQKSYLADGTDTSFTGFMQPRRANGSWLFQEPSRGSPANWENCCGMFSADVATYEGSAWMYTLYAPGDGAQLVSLLGGDDEFTRRLDYMHDNDLIDIGDEQVFLPVFQYHYAGRPGKSTERAHFYIPRLFNSTLVGIPGNDDSGAMGAFVVFSMLGLFPVAGMHTSPNIAHQCQY